MVICHYPKLKKYSYTIPHGILKYQHSDFLQPFTEFLYIVADKTVRNVYFNY